MTPFPNGHAVIVGIADYPHINPLPRTVLEDARGVSSVLTNLQICGYDPASVVTLLNEHATKVALQNALQNSAKRCDLDSTFLFYVSSHGGRIEDGDRRGEYLLPVDTIYQDADSLDRSSIAGQELTELLRAIPARRMVAIFDCCHSAGIGQPKASTAPDLKQGLSEQYYKQLATGQGRVVFASCRDCEFSYVRRGDANSVFTKHLLDGLQGGAPGPGGVVRVFDLFHYLQPKVVANQPNQHPVFKCELEENFPLTLHLGGKGTPLPTATETPRDAFKYDVFLSYRQQEPDKTWTQTVLLPRLKTEGLRVCIDIECFQLGGHLIAEMEKAVEASRYTLAVLSPGYLESNFTELENILAEHLGLELSQRRLLAVMRERCKPRLGMRARLWLDMRDNKEFDANVARLVHELRMPPHK
jgi:hypothetical protein